MSWLTPAFEEINMSAEIGGYQGDYGDGNTPPVVKSTDDEASVQD
jgi:hypothetical protein